MTINRLITDVNRWEGRFGQSVEWIVLHYTAGKGDTARGNCLYFLNEYRAASAHFFVDETSVWQSVELEDSAWHVGDAQSRNGATNLNSIGIEMCSDYKDGAYYISDPTVQNALELVWYLLELYPNAKLCRHYDVTGKRCPMPWVDNPRLWDEFYTKAEAKRPMTDAEKKAFKALEKKVNALSTALEKNSLADENLTVRVGICEDTELAQAKEIKAVDSRTEVKYNSVAECPKWLKPTVEKLVKKGYLKGDGKGLALTYDMARILVIEDRAGVFD